MASPPRPRHLGRRPAARAAVTVVISLGWQALTTRAHNDQAVSLPTVMTRYLLTLPHAPAIAASLKPLNQENQTQA